MCAFPGELPLVSIITISYNSAKTIRDTLISVASQDYPHIEHIIIDGDSTDGTLAIVNEFPHIRKIISEPDDGLYDAMNKGILASTGEIVGILNSDDFYLGVDVISSVIHTMREERTDALFADLFFVHRSQTNRVFRYWKTGPYGERKFLFGWMPPHPTFFVKRQLYSEYGIFKTQLTFSADYELMLRFLYKHRINVSYLPKVIIKMRTGGVSNASIFNRLKANREDREAWRLNGLRPFFFTTWLKPIRKVMQFLNNKSKTI